MGWEFIKKDKLYPSVGAPIPYVVMECWRGVHVVKMVLGASTPTDTQKLMGLRELAEAEYAAISGQWSGEMVQLIDSGKLTFDLVFADDLVDTRNRPNVK